MFAFCIWVSFGVIIILIGIYDFFSKKPAGFWANANPPEISGEKLKAYNHAVGKLFCGFGIVFALLGIPLLNGQNSAGVLITMLGTMAEVIVTMAIYTIVIEKKYLK